jgi:diguanylate cyclase (GGDEF)-like protein/PAS domain S-box-containing protein
MTHQSTSRSSWTRYLTAIALVVLAAVSRIWPLQSLGSNLEWLTFYPAVMIAAIYGGLFAGLLATILSCMTTTLFWSLIVATPFIVGSAHRLGVFIFFLNGCMVSGVAETMLRAQARAIKAEEQAKALSQSRVLFDNSPTGMFAIAPHNGRIVQANNIALKMFGYNADEMLTKTLDELTYPDDLAETQQRYEKLSKGLTDNQSYEKRYLRKDGSYFWGAATVSTLKDAYGKASLFIANTLDISERKRNEIALRESANRYRTLLDNLPQIIWQKDLDLVYVSSNATLARSLKVATEDMPGKTDFDFYSTELANKYRDDDRRIIQADASETLEEKWIANGNELVMRTTKVPLHDEQGSIYGTLGISEDITERKRLEQEKEQYFRFFRLSTDLMCIADPFGCFKQVNPALVKELGFEESELIAKPFLEFILPEDRQRTTDEMKLQVAVRPSLHFENRFVCKDGKVISLLWTAYFDKKDGITYATARNITELKLAEETAQASEERLRLAMKAANQGWFDVDLLSGKVAVSPEYVSMLGYDPDEFISDLQNWLANVHPDDRDALTATFEACIRSGGPSSMEYRRRTKSGDWKWVQSIGNVVQRDAQQRAVRMIGIHTDINERKNAESEIRIAATVFESQEGMTVTDVNGKILRVNRAFTGITGYTAEEAVGKNPRLLKSGHHDADFYATMWRSINNTGSWEGEIWNRRKNGEVYPELLTITAVKNTDGITVNYVGTFSDITLSNAAADEIKHLAFYDPLTRLPNRRLLMDRLQQALASSARSGRAGALLFIDLDNFKTLNDTLGHDMGDLLLQQVALRLESCVREGDTVARLGGDEFVVMLEDLSGQPIEAAAQTESVGNKILVTLNQTYQLKMHEHHNTPSIGATLFNDHKNAIDELLKQADIAMYQAKNAGRNALRFFDPQMQDSISTRASIERELYKALDNRQFQLYYQIQVDGRQEHGSHHTKGAEALIRWIHPERGVVLPAQFIPLAEETGQILPIGQWVLETACTQIKAWQQNLLTRDLVLAVNVSARQFRQTDFVAQVRDVIRRHAVNPALLKLELTESLLLENIEDTIATMNALNEIGVQFSLDDFGTGYSSLQYLKRLPLSQIKIDQSFVRDLASNNSDRAIVRTIIAMAKSLNLNVIAEGVETEEQRQMLLNKGCIHHQGYLFGEPVPIEQFEAQLKRG